MPVDLTSLADARRLARRLQGAARAGEPAAVALAGRYSFPDVDAPQAYVLEVRSSTQGTLASATLVLAASQAAQIDMTVGTRSISPTPTTG